jgi:diguanylate cyclase
VQQASDKPTSPDKPASLDKSASPGEQAFELMKQSSCPITPRAYEVWFSFAKGDNPALRAEMRELQDKGIAISTPEIDKLYETHIEPRNFTGVAEKTGVGVISEINNVMEMMDLAMGSTASYGQSLVMLSDDLNRSADRNSVRQIVESLVLATRETIASNKTLEARLKESRGEIMNLREALESVRVDALTDPVTCLGNRKHFDEMLIKSIDEANIKKSELALIIVDIDHFKKFNDSYGHLTGDQVLRLVGSTMRERVKRKSTLARFGGEEFAIILPDASLDVAKDIAELVRRSVMARELVKRSTGENLGRVTISLGVAALRKGDTPPLFLERADQVMFCAKRAGRNRVLTEKEVNLESIISAA